MRFPVPALRPAPALLAAAVLSIVGCSDGDPPSAPAAPSVPAADEAPSSPPPRRAEHLLLISIDALRANRLACYGGRAGISPSVDWLAAEGVRFSSCHAPMGMTLPSVTSLFTSRYPDETGVVHNQARLDPREWTLAERLKESGFRTRAYIANGVLRPGASGIDQGFDAYERIYDEYKMTTLAVDAIESGFGAEGRDFLWVHYMDPHQPYDRREPFATEYLGAYDGPYDAEAETLDRIFVEKEALAPRDLEAILAVYDSQVRYIATQIGRVLSALETSGRAAETLVVLTADHGEELYARNAYFYHANSLYASVTHVPLIFKQSGTVPKGVVVDDLVELVDVMPTVLAHLGIEPGAGDAVTRARGLDLHDAFEGAEVRRGDALAQLARSVYALRTPRWLLVDNPDGYVPRSVPEEGEYPIAAVELYDLERDAAERLDVATAHPDVVEKMRRRLEARRRRLVETATEKQEMSAEDLEELEQLGYLGDK